MASIDTRSYGNYKYNWMTVMNTSHSMNGSDFASIMVVNTREFNQFKLTVVANHSIGVDDCQINIAPCVNQLGKPTRWQTAQFAAQENNISTNTSGEAKYANWSALSPFTEIKLKANESSFGGAAPTVILDCWRLGA